MSDAVEDLDKPEEEAARNLGLPYVPAENVQGL
jgi:hypothetical protein